MKISLKSTDITIPEKTIEHIPNNKKINLVDLLCKNISKVKYYSIKIHGAPLRIGLKKGDKINIEITNN